MEKYTKSALTWFLYGLKVAKGYILADKTDKLDELINYINNKIKI